MGLLGEIKTRMIEGMQCAGCNVALDVNRIRPYDPCPTCGSFEKLVRHKVSDEIVTTFRERAHRADKERCGKRKRSIHEIIAGDSFCQQTGQWNNRRQVFDRRNDYYEEIVSNSKTGEVVHEDRGRLSEHHNHGSAKKKRGSTTMHDDSEKEAYVKKMQEEKKKRQAACKHENTKKEKIGGMDTGDRKCLDCGAIV